MQKAIRVVYVGPALSVRGGISRLIETIKCHLPDHISFRHVSTFTRYTGAQDTDPSDQGSRFVQALVFVWAFVQIFVFAVRRPTVFHVHLSNGGSVVRKGLICIALRTLRCEYIVHAHAADANLFHPWLPRGFRRALLWGIAGATRFIALTQLWYNHYSSSLKLSSDHLLLLPNPADLPKSVPDRDTRHGAKLLFLGRIGERKGALDIIRAFAGLPDDVRLICELTLAGDGDVDAAQNLTSQLNCLSQVSVPGWVGAAEVERLLADSDIFLLPSQAEGMAMSLVEAMSWGLAVVTTAVGGAGEFLEDGRNSILVSPGDVEGIRKAICALTCSADLRTRLGQAARETISRFSIDNYIVTLCELYEELASKTPKNRSTELCALGPNTEIVACTSGRRTKHSEPGQH